MDYTQKVKDFAKRRRNRFLRPWSTVADPVEVVIDVHVDVAALGAVASRVGELGHVAYRVGPGAGSNPAPRGRCLLRLILPSSDSVGSGRSAAIAARTVRQLNEVGVPVLLHAVSTRPSVTRHAVWENNGITVGPVAGTGDRTRYFPHVALMSTANRQRLALGLGVVAAALGAVWDHSSARRMLLTISIIIGLAFLVAAALEVRPSDWRRALARMAATAAVASLFLGALVRDRLIAFYDALGVDVAPANGPALLIGQPLLVVAATTTIVAATFLLAVTARRGRRRGQPSFLVNVVPVLLVMAFAVLASAVADQPYATAQSLRAGDLDRESSGLLLLPKPVPVLPVPPAAGDVDPLGPGAWIRLSAVGDEGPTFVDILTGRVVSHLREAPTIFAVDELLTVRPGVMQDTVRVPRTPFTLGISPLPTTCTAAVTPSSGVATLRVGGALSLTLKDAQPASRLVEVTCQGQVATRVVLRAR